MIGNNHDKNLVSLRETLNDTTESPWVISLLIYGLRSGSGLSGRYGRLRAAPKQIWQNSHAKTDKLTAVTVEVWENKCLSELRLQPTVFASILFCDCGSKGFRHLMWRLTSMLFHWRLTVALYCVAHVDVDFMQIGDQWATDVFISTGQFKLQWKDSYSPVEKRNCLSSQ